MKVTARVHAIANEIAARNVGWFVPGNPEFRVAVIDQAVSEGINASTAATQYAKWMRARRGDVVVVPKAPRQIIAPRDAKPGQLYAAMSVTSAMRGERNDCAVIALALATGVGYAEAHAALAAQGRRNGQGTYQGQQFRALAALGFKAERVELSVKTTKAIAKGAAVPAGALWVYTRRHVSAVINGVVEDWAASRSKRITEAYSIIKA